MTNKKHFILLVGVLLLVTIIFTIRHINKDKINLLSPGERSGTSALTKKRSTSVKAFKVDSPGWGYEILLNNKRFIYQDRIPAIPSKKTFQSRNEALKCGELMLKKMIDGKMPALSIHEIDSLSIYY